MYHRYQLARLFRWADNWLATRVYPYDYFGHLSQPEKERFFEHNRWIDRRRSQARKIAVWLQRGFV